MTLTMDYRKKLMEYRRSIGATSTPAISRSVAFRDSDLNVNESNNQSHSLQRNIQLPQSQQQGRTLLSVEEDDFVSDNRRTPTRDSSALRVSSLSPSPQPQPRLTPLKEDSFLYESIGRYANWNSHHGFLCSQPWCCIGDLMTFCDKYEFKAISVSDVQMHANIVSEVRSLLSGKAPFDMRRRFPGNIRNTENLYVCIGRCPSIEYHLERILTAFRRPFNKLSTEKQNVAKQNFHLAVRELHLDISARISEIKLYDRNVFEKEFHLKWQDSSE